MSGTFLVDTGPLVAYLVCASQHHDWTCEQMKRLEAPLLTCEPVLSEAGFILLRHRQDPDALLEMLEIGMLQIAFSLEDETQAVRHLVRRYRDVPMSIADACLVRMSELKERSTVFTLDTDFRIYRRHGRKLIPTLMPPGI
jgi:predicted nucleic acid-binding protein